ncbi:MAG: hypothetical protein KDA64_10275 [Rhodospirillaceae bacterium]|nr:hypothetical protein [Rhodospirillaceae bacterium]
MAPVPPRPTQLAQVLDAGGRLLSQRELAALVSGNTLRGELPNGTPFTVYFAADGRKAVLLDGARTEVRWYMDDDGRFCEESVARARSHIGVDIYACGGWYLLFDEDGRELERSQVVPGNPAGL